MRVATPCSGSVRGPGSGSSIELADAYCGILASYAWVFHREASWVRRVLWFVGIMLLGNIALALYMLILLFRLPAGGGAERVLLRPRA
jgi:hypothetical protein